MHRWSPVKTSLNRFLTSLKRHSHSSTMVKSICEPTPEMIVVKSKIAPTTLLLREMEPLWRSLKSKWQQFLTHKGPTRHRSKPGSLHRLVQVLPTRSQRKLSLLKPSSKIRRYRRNTRNWNLNIMSYWSS